MQYQSKFSQSVMDREEEPEKKLKFAKNSKFQAELRRRVDELFQSNVDLKQRDCPEMYAKTAILLSSFFGTYALLVFFAQTWWQVVPLCIMLGAITAGIGFSVQHDGAHRAYSDSQWVNKLMAMSIDLIGCSSYLWNLRHNIFHHTFVNVADYDMDLEVGSLARLSPSHPLLPIHRWQHYYMWPMYGFMTLKWQVYDDFHCLVTGKIGVRTYSRPKGSNLAIFLGGKVVFFTLAFIIPLFFHSIWQVLASYGLASLVLGVVLGIVFQLAHSVEEADFPIAENYMLENDWAIHQIETTANFSRNNPYITWLIGGLNFQIEHHLFPNICHINYPAISKIVEQTCQEYGVRYNQHSSLWAGFQSHFRWLRRMGTA